MPRARISRIEATAHHEAGHAVASWHCGIRFKYVTIVPDDTQNSLGHLENNSSPCVQILTQDHIYVGLAGQIAEAKFRGRLPRYGMNADNQKAFDLAIICTFAARRRWRVRTYDTAGGDQPIYRGSAVARNNNGRGGASALAGNYHTLLGKSDPAPRHGGWAFAHWQGRLPPGKSPANQAALPLQ
jgi:hypothetical protein